MNEVATPADPPGLTEEEARRRLGQNGPNTVSEERVPPWRLFLAKFLAPVPWLLEAAIAIQLAIGASVEAAVIAGLLLFNAVIGVVQEGRASAVLAALKSRLAPTAIVRRNGQWAVRPAAELVPGDAIRLPLGAIVPADARLCTGSILVDQSMLTGESIPVDAKSGDQVYAGALVRRGQAVAEVSATGRHTFFGRAAELVRLAHAASTEQTAILGAVRNLAVINGTLAILVVAYGHWLGLASADLVRLGLTALLATIPVALPATFTLSAAMSARALARHGVLLTRLSAAHEAASMTVLCSDKTGTLTRNALTVEKVLPMTGFDERRVLALASSEADQDPIDATIRRAAGAAGGPAGMRLVRFVPFDPSTKMSEAFLADSDGRPLRVVKGAFQVIAAAAETPPGVRALADQLAAEGRRVLAVAAGAPESLRLAGFVALSDPPREDSAAMVARLRALGVHTVMVTEDSAVTAAAIARKVGIEGDVAQPDLLAGTLRVEQFGVFARVLPEDKYRLVKTLQDSGYVVGMCGDGVNDAPALRQAQIGIAVSTATDVAKAAAVAVLTEPGLGGIVAAVIEGRVAFQRLLTYALNMLHLNIG